jgi:outer membrane protein insertion porin family
MLPRLLLLSVLCQWAGSAQTPAKKKAAPKAAAPAQTPTQPDKFPIRAIHIRGNRTLGEPAILSVTGLAPNQVAGKAELDAAKDKLLATGMFETVAFQFEPGTDGQCCVANFDVAEITALFPVQYENIPEPAADIEAFLKSKNPLYGPKLPGSTAVLDAYAHQIEQFLASRNHPGKVLGVLTQTGKNDFKITFRTNESIPAISSVTFTGNKAIISVKLQNAINDVAFGQPFTQDGFRQLLDNQIRPLYDAMGMIRVKFPAFTTEPDPRVKGVIVHVTVEEGAVYKLGKVAIAGADTDLLKTAKIKTGELVNFDEIKQGLDRVKQSLKRSGYLKVDGTVDRNIDDKAMTVDVVLNMEKGPQYTMGKLTIQGLDLNGEPAVRKLWSYETGKPFNALYPDYFLDRIRENGMFDGLGATKATTQIDENTHVVDVTLTFGSSPKPIQRKRPGT